VAAPAFSLGASAIYIVNDLLDLEADRLHPSKRNRPIASGRLPIRAAMVASAGLTVAALGLAYAVRPSVAGLIAVYMTSTLIYSLWLKKLRWVDVLTLAVLFMMRVVAGALAAQITLSPWLLSVVFTVFLTLAVVKRLTELSRQPSRNHMPGRGYDRGDLPVLLKLAVVSVAASLTLFLGYSFSPNAALLYDRPWVLALAAVPMGLWLARVIRLSVQGREDYDPVVFVTHDGPGLALLSLFAGLVVLAS
jgi:4-hydroxybenzoate polyprenyltransferase